MGLIRREAGRNSIIVSAYVIKTNYIKIPGIDDRRRLGGVGEGSQTKKKQSETPPKSEPSWRLSKYLFITKP